MSDMYFKSLPDKSTPLIPTNLDKLNDIKVSPTQPTTNEKVWIQMSKNLLKAPFTKSNKKTITSSSDDFSEITDYSVYLEAGKQYTISFKTDGVPGSNGADTVELFLLKNKNAGEGFYQINTNPKTITVGASGDYYVRFDVNKNGRTYSFWDIQIEKGSTATEYEPYVEKAIHIKNDNGVYEEFYNESKINNPVPINYTDYIEFKSGTTVNTASGYKIGNSVYIAYDIATSYNAGQTKIGTIKKPLLIACYGGARTSIGGDTNKFRPATTLAISQGDFRILTADAGSLIAGQIQLLINEN